MAFQLLLVISGVESPTQATEDSIILTFTLALSSSLNHQPLYGWDPLLMPLLQMDLQTLRGL